MFLYLFFPCDLIIIFHILLKRPGNFYNKFSSTVKFYFEIGHFLKENKDLNDNTTMIQNLAVICQFVTGVVQ